VGSPYDETMSGTEFQTGEWGLAGLDLNYFAARYYDPILGRWHAPDPLEQCHSPYLAMLVDPANFIDPDGRAGIPFLQDFMKSDGGTFLLNLAGQATFLGAMLSPFGSIGGTLSNIVSIGASLYSAGSSVKNLAEFTSEGSTKTYARYDFSADFSMMKSSRHAGMAFEGAANESNGDPEPNLGQLTIYYTVSFADDGTRTFWKYTLTMEINNPASGNEDSPIGNLVVDEVVDIPVGEVAQSYSDPNDLLATIPFLSLYPRIDPYEPRNLFESLLYWHGNRIRSIDGVRYDQAGYAIGLDGKSMVFEFGADRGAGKGIKLLKALSQGKKAKNIANSIPKGFKLTKEFGYLHGEKVYKYKGLYYSKDADAHLGGVWKVFEKVNGRLKRIGTADENLVIFSK
jgi:RHS repeat-associated protein